MSNERRCYEEPRDWKGEVEDTIINKPFEIHLRNWREKIITGSLIDKPLSCNLSAHVAEILKVPATWAYEQNLRLHFEWVWDGRIIYLVQADQEHETKGVDPVCLSRTKANVQAKFVPQCLKKISLEHAQQYRKIRNVFTYMKLGLWSGIVMADTSKSVL